jgi:hypothetical protein
MKQVQILQAQLNDLNNQEELIKADILATQNDYFGRLEDKFYDIFKNILPEDITLRVSFGGVSFVKLDERGTSLTDVFNIYFQKEYGSSDEYTDCYLSYYSTRCDSEYEFNRLITLGKIAELLKSEKEMIVKINNDAWMEYKEKVDSKYKAQYKLTEQISSIKKQLNDLNKETLKKELFTNGVMFLNRKNVKLKSNYTPTLQYIKLEDVSKSGKKAKAVFKLWGNDTLMFEDKVNVENIIKQVI